MSRAVAAAFSLYSLGGEAFMKARAGYGVAPCICDAPLARLNRVCIESCRGREALSTVGDTFRQTLRERLAGWVNIRGRGQ
jgi:hypothetical protein